jgi:hypothetical protein
MKTVSLTLAILIVLAVGGLAQQPGSAQAGNPTISLSISSAQDTVKSGSPITVKVAITNVSGHRIGFPWLSDAGWNFELIVRDSHGNPVSPASRNARRKDGRLDVKIRTGEGVAHYLQPGESETHEFNVSDLKNLAQPGEYTIQVQRADPETKVVVKSNMITVAVTP